MWAAADLRRRWKGLVVLGLLAGLSSGLAMAAIAGARRTESAFPRLREATHASDAVIFTTQVGITDPDWSKLEAKPYVKRLAKWNLMFGNQNGEPNALIFGPAADGVLFSKVDKPVVLEGRMYDPARADEVVIDEGAEHGYHLHLGSRFKFQFFKKGPDDFSGKPPTGRTIDFKVVGVVRETSALLFTDGQIFPSKRCHEAVRRLDQRVRERLRATARSGS